MFLDNEKYKLLLIIPCKIENMAYNIYIAITLEKTKIILKKFRIVAGSLPHKPRNFGYKNLTRLSKNCILSGGYFNFSHSVFLDEITNRRSSVVLS